MARNGQTDRSRDPDLRARVGTLGTFAGVFTPSILTILGIILFLRMGWVVGSGGLLRTLAIVAIANVISLLTTISLSAIATNMRVKGGGDYYLISRTLGVEFGGALGLVLYLAQSISIAFYAIGFGEAIRAITGGAAWLPQVVAAAAVAALFVLAWLGADWATRFQYAVMTVLFAAIVAFFVGGLGAWDPGLLRENLSGSAEIPFWAIFALFFPAVTGFTQGVSMSGDLKDPGRSLPTGTFLAVGISFVVYLGVAVVFAGAESAEVLVNDLTAMRGVSIFPWLIDAGVIAATLSSALASFLGAPRILQSLGRDNVFPLLRPFAIGSGPSGNPRRGVLLSAAIAFGTIALGDLNLIAPIVSMFFLISYGLLNYATWVEARANSPYFRPRFRFFDKRLSLLGGLGCLGAMLAIHPTAGVVAVVLVFAVHQYVAKTVTIERWADASRSRLFQRVRDDLLKISGELGHPRDWRPVILVFSEMEERRERGLRFAEWIEGGSGFTTAVKLIRGQGPKARVARMDADKKLRAELDRKKLKAFVKVAAGPDLDRLFPALLQSHGLGRVRANTVLVNWLDDRTVEPERVQARSDSLRRSLRYDCNVVVLAAEARDFAAVEEMRPEQRQIDVWYRDNATGRMMLMLAYLMTRTSLWNEASIRVFLKADAEEESASREKMERELEEVRIHAKVLTVGGTTAAEVYRHSGDSAMVFLPFRLGDDGPGTVLDCEINELVDILGITALTLATADVPLDAEPEEGPHGEIANAVDAADAAARGRRVAEKAVAEAERAVIRARNAWEAGRTAGDPPETITGLEQAVETAEREVERSRRKAAKAGAKADLTAVEARSLTGDEEIEDEHPDETGSSEDVNP